MKRKVFLKFKSVIKYISIFVILIVCYNGLLFGISKIPSSMMKSTVEKSAEILRGQGIQYYFSYYGFNDNNTDALMINNAYSIDSEKPFDSYMWDRKNYDPMITQGINEETDGELVSYDKTNQKTEEYNTPNELYDFMDGKITHSVSYQGYWHGYLVFLRLLLLIFNVTELRVVRLLILGVVVLYLLKILKRNFGFKAVFGMLAIVILYEFYSVAAMLASFPVLLITLLFSIFLLKKVGKDGKAIHFEKLYKYFFIVGSIVNFVDLRSIPLVSLGIPLLFILMKYNATQRETNARINAKKCVKFVMGATLIWLAGYTVTWLAKLVIFMIYTNSFDIANIFAQIGNGMSSQVSSTTGVEIVYLFGLAMIVAVISLVLVIVRHKKAKTLRQIVNDSLATFIVGLFPVIWVMILFNHSVLNANFVYRITMISALACEMISIYVFEPRKKKKKQKWEKWNKLKALKPTRII